MSSLPDGTESVSSLISIENGVSQDVTTIHNGRNRFRQSIRFTQLHFSNTLPTPEVDSQGQHLYHIPLIIKMCREEFPHTTIILGRCNERAHIHHYMDLTHDHISVGSGSIQSKPIDCSVNENKKNIRTQIPR